MKRMTISLAVTAVILAVGTAAIWFLFTSRRPQPAPPAAEPPPTTEPERPPEAMDAALNLYMAAPARMPAGAGRIEMKLTSAALLRADGTEATLFQGSRKLVLQEGTTEKLLSEKMPVGRWDRLKLTFSPAADLSFGDGRPDAAALVARHEAVLTFEASDIAASRTLALFARAPLEPETAVVGGVAALDFSATPAPAERYVFGAYLLDARGRGDIFTLASPSLAAAVKADVGFDITRQLEGSNGFVPSSGETPASP